jgi:hypothetical protein
VPDYQLTRLACLKLYLLLKSGPLSPKESAAPVRRPSPPHPRWAGAVTSTVDLWRITALAEAVQIFSVVCCSGNRSNGCKPLKLYSNSLDN